MTKKPSFSLHEFKDWMSRNPDTSGICQFGNRPNPIDEIVGCEVRAKVSSKKLMERIRPQDGDAETLVDDLVENGGQVLSAEGRSLVIEVENGSFSLPRFCVSIVKQD